MIDECLLHRRKITLATQALYCRHFRTVMHNSKTKAAVHSDTVEQDGASTTLAMVAALFTAGQLQGLSEEIEQGCPWLDGQQVHLIIDN